MIYLYSLISIIWFSVFYAFMQKHKPQNKYTSNIYWSDGEWKSIYIILMIVGVLFWWVAILVIIFVKLANKYLFNK